MCGDIRACRPQLEDGKLSVVPCLCEVDKVWPADVCGLEPSALGPSDSSDCTLLCAVAVRVRASPPLPGNSREPLPILLQTGNPNV